MAFYCHTFRGLVSSSLSDRWLVISMLVKTYHNFARQNERGSEREAWKQQKKNCEHNFSSDAKYAGVFSVHCSKNSIAVLYLQKKETTKKHRTD